MAKEYFVKEEDIDVLKNNVDKKISSPNTAEVGQILSVKAIDGNGKPTEWEVVNKPGSGPGESSPYIYMTQAEYEALEKYEQDKMYWVTYPSSNRYLIWKNGEAFGLGAVQPTDSTVYKHNDGWVFNYNLPAGTYSTSNFFIKTPIKYVDITFNVTEIKDYTFYNCNNLKSITIPNSVTSIGNMVFYKCTALNNVTISNSITSIKSATFKECKSLESITLPNTLTSIANDVFCDCTALANIYYKGTEEQWNAIPKESGWNTNMGSNVTGGTVIHYNS